MFSSSFIAQQKILSLDTLNPRVLKTQYAVRGELVIKANQFEQKLKNKNHGLPFDSIIYCNIGNPQQLKQKPLTYFKHVISSVATPELVEEPPKFFKKDTLRRAKKILDSIAPGYSGAYTHSQGLPIIRESVADFIYERDSKFSKKVERPSPDRIFLTNGASSGVSLWLQCLIRDEKDGIMIPIPQYPLYSASIALYGGSQINYYLDEKLNWGLSIKELKRSYDEAIDNGILPRALSIINPGNPTGQVLSRENMFEIVDFCQKKRLILLSDEVYQENIYQSGKDFHSFNEIIHEMDLQDTFELVSFHSTSKGFLGECGRRGGYFQMSKGFENSVYEQIYKLSSVGLCSNVDGQVLVECMVNPPKPGDESYEEYISEKNSIIESLKKRAKKLSQTLNKLEGYSCNEVEGAMYAFPQIKLPQKFVELAKKEGKNPDLYYCNLLLEKTGICVVPGSGFGQVDGTFHFRTTILPPESEFDKITSRISKFHKEFLSKFS